MPLGWLGAISGKRVKYLTVTRSSECCFRCVHATGRGLGRGAGMLKKMKSRICSRLMNSVAPALLFRFIKGHVVRCCIFHRNRLRDFVLVSSAKSGSSPAAAEFSRIQRLAHLTQGAVGSINKFLTVESRACVFLVLSDLTAHDGLESDFWGEQPVDVCSLPRDPIG